MSSLECKTATAPVINWEWQLTETGHKREKLWHFHIDVTRDVMTTCSTLTCGSQNQRTFFLQISNCICYFYMIKTRAKFHQFRRPGRRISHFLPCKVSRAWTRTKTRTQSNSLGFGPLCDTLWRFYKEAYISLCSCNGHVITGFRNL